MPTDSPIPGEGAPAPAAAPDTAPIAPESDSPVPAPIVNPEQGSTASVGRASAPSRIEQVQQALARARAHTHAHNEALTGIHDQLTTELPKPVREAIAKINEAAALLGTFVTNAELLRPPIDQATTDARAAHGIALHVFEGMSDQSYGMTEVVKPLSNAVRRNGQRAIGQPIRRAKAAERRLQGIIAYLNEKVLPLLPQSTESGGLPEDSRDVASVIRANIADGIVAQSGLYDYTGRL